MSRSGQTPTLRALIIGDSLGAPRPHRGQKLENTWPVLLKTKFPQIDIWQRCRAGSMSNEVLKEYHLFSDSIDRFDLLVIQVGIGDCCPRPYPLFLEQFILTYGFRRLHKWLNSLYPTLLKFRSRPWISRKEYAANLKQMIDTTRERNPGAKVCLIKIGTPHGEFVKKVWNVPEYATAYNDALVELCRSYPPESNVALLDPYQNRQPDELFIADGHHLTVCGHQVIAQFLAPHLSALLAEKSSPHPITLAGGNRPDPCSSARPPRDMAAHAATANVHSL